MKQRMLANRLPVSVIGLGCMGMSVYYGERDDAQSLRTIERALELGITHFDTADQYGDGHNELLLGRGLGRHRKDVVIASKGGILPAPDAAGRTVRGDAAYLQQACDNSLRRLNTDYIDLYYLHRLDPLVPVEESLGGLTRLVEAGKVRFLGLSEAPAAQIRRAHKVAPLTAVQSEYSLWSRDVEAEVLPALRELGIAFVAFSPLSRGFLSGTLQAVSELKATDARVQSERFLPENFAKNRLLVDRLQQLARARGCTAAQLALAWLLSQGNDVVAIPGTKRADYLDENAAAADIELTAQEGALIASAVPSSEVQGQRFLRPRR